MNQNGSLFRVNRALRRSLTLIFCVLVPGLFPADVSAHPHVFIDARVEFEFSGEQLEGFWVEWRFDEMFTAMIVLDYRAPRSGPFPERTVRAIEQGAFSNLQYYDYFTYVFTGGRPRPVDQVKNFTAYLDDNRLVYRFFVPHSQPVISGEDSVLSVRMYDETFFTDIAFHTEAPVSDNAGSVAGSGIRTSSRVYQNTDKVIEYDPTSQTARREGARYTGVTHPYEAEIRFRAVE
jgi:ABC-type uncharacterized transport system substrate-binding protein